MNLVPEKILHLDYSELSYNFFYNEEFDPGSG